MKVGDLIKFNGRVYMAGNVVGIGDCSPYATGILVKQTYKSCDKSDSEWVVYTDDGELRTVRACYMQVMPQDNS